MHTPKSKSMAARASTRTRRANLLKTLNAIIEMHAMGQKHVSTETLATHVTDVKAPQMRIYVAELVKLKVLSYVPGAQRSRDLEKRCNKYFLLPNALSIFERERPFVDVAESTLEARRRALFHENFCGPMLPKPPKPVTAPKDTDAMLDAVIAPKQYRTQVETHRLADVYQLPDQWPLITMFFGCGVSAASST